MKVFVTGGEGFFASWLIPALQEAGHEVVPYDMKSGGDMLDVEATAAAMAGCEAVIHLAAFPHYKPEIPAQDFERRNIIGTARVVRAMKKAGIKRLVYTSSGAIYGFGPNRSLNGWVQPPISEDKLPVRENWPMLDAYSGSKLACEEWLQNVPGLTITALRINCIEPYQDGARDHGAHWGWWCSQATASKAFAAALERTKRGFEAINVGEPSPHMDYARMDALMKGEL